MKIQRDLKELIDRNGSIFGSSKVEQEKDKNPLKNFFIDEMNLTRKTLNLIRVDVESTRFEDNKVKNLEIYFDHFILDFILIIIII